MMLPESVRRLLEQSVNSIEKLEIVVALGPPHSPMTLAQLEAALPLERERLEEALHELGRDGVLATVNDAYQVTATHAADVANLVTYYDQDRLIVLSTLTTIAVDRIRGMAARTFADAFVLRRKKRDRDG